jgi:type I restriction enzyme S subunit
VASFETITIDEAAERLIDYRGKTPPKTELGIRLITAKVVKGGQIHDDPAEYIAADFYDEWMRRGLPQKFDVLITTEAPLGEVAILRSEERIALAQRIILLRAKRGEIDPEYLFYALQSDFSQGELRARASGTTVLGIKQSELRQVRIPKFPLPEQKRIAGILSAYDELIENSQRRIKVLETMARNLYREWFVHYRNPGHEKVKMVPSSLGEIPEGWEVKPIGDWIQFKSGFAFKSGTFSENGNHRLVTIKNVQDGSFVPESDSRFDEIPQKLPGYCILKDGDILLSLTGNVGRTCLVYGGECFLNQRVSKLEPVNDFDWAITYCIFRENEMRKKLEQLSNGVAQQNLSPVLASKMHFICAPAELRKNFSDKASPMLKLLLKNYEEILNLRKTRDLLLPRLLSGQIPLHTPDTQAA